MAEVQVQWETVGLQTPLAARFDHTISTVEGQKGKNVFAIGGHGGLEDGFEVQVLDETLTAWIKFPTTVEPGSDVVPLKRGSHAAAAVGSSIFVIGGFGDEKSLGDVLELDTDEGSWSVPSLAGVGPSPRSSHTATAVGPLIYVIGGYGDDNAYNDVHILDTVSKKWIKPMVLGDAPSPRCSHSADAIGGQKIVIFGGYSTKPLNDVWFLEVDTPYVQQQREALGVEHLVAWSEGIVGQLPTPVVICGPSGVGKGTLINKLMEEFPDNCGFSVSHTTRNPREGEVDTVHYHFTTRAWMEPEVKEGRFLESADVHGNMYGTSIAAVQKVSASGKMCILDIDVQGAEQVKRSPIPALFVFVAPPSFEELERRLRGRGTETEAQVEKRLKNAKAELERGDDTSLFDHKLVNDDLEACYGKLKEILGLGGDSLNDSKEKQEGLVVPPRSGHAAAVLGSRLVVYGGTANKGTVLDDVLVLETKDAQRGAPTLTTGLAWVPVKDTPPTLWSSLWGVLGYETTALVPMARYNHRAVTLSEDKVLVAGGYDGGNDKPLGDSAVISIEH